MPGTLLGTCQVRLYVFGDGATGGVGRLGGR